MLDIIKKATIANTEEDTIRVGDQIRIPIEGFGTFTATAEEVTDSTILFIFDDIVEKRPMNETNTNTGGFKGSQLYKWLQEILLPAFPNYLRERISELTIPTVGQISGWSDAWDKEHFESDGDQQLQLMKDRKHRIASFEGDFAWYWLQNASKADWSSAGFAGVGSYGNPNSSRASASGGVRPAFLLVKEKSGGRVPHNSRVSYKRYYAHGRQDEISKESLMREINEKVNEIDILKQEIERLDKEHQYDEGASEIKALMDSFIRAGFAEGQAFHMVMNMLTTMLGGLR